MPSLSVVPAAARSIFYLGMDVHKDTITIAVLPDIATAPTRVERLPNELPTPKKWQERMPSVKYEKEKGTAQVDRAMPRNRKPTPRTHQANACKPTHS